MFMEADIPTPPPVSTVFTAAAVDVVDDLTAAVRKFSRTKKISGFTAGALAAVSLAGVFTLTHRAPPAEVIRVAPPPASPVIVPQLTELPPVPAFKGVNLQRINPKLLKGLSLAGGLLGEAFVIIKGFYTAEQEARDRNAPGLDPRRPTIAQNHSEHTGDENGAIAVDFYTMDKNGKEKSGPEKARMVEALMEFLPVTGIAEYHMVRNGRHFYFTHVDLRKTAATWGKPLDPEVRQTLVAHNWRPGRRGRDIKVGKGYAEPPQRRVASRNSGYRF